MIYEIFKCTSGQTEGFRLGLVRTKQTVERCEKAGLIYDYLPAHEGFYVLDDHDSVKAGPMTKERAESFAMIENMGSDTRTFRVVEQKL